MSSTTFWSTRRITRKLASGLGLMAVLGLVAVAAPGCNKGDAQSAKRSDEAKKSAKKTSEIRDGLSEDWRLEHPECLDGRKIEKLTPNTPEATLWQVFEAASGPDSEENFAKFFAALDPDKYKEEWARDQFWKRSREHVSKYVESATDPTFIVCREDKKSDTKTKLYVYSKVSSKSHTPYGLVKKDDGSWKIEFFTP